MYQPAFSGVSTGALKAEPSERVLQLSVPKKDYEGYVFAKPVMNLVSGAAKKAIATERIEQLSKPKN